MLSGGTLVLRILSKFRLPKIFLSHFSPGFAPKKIQHLSGLVSGSLSSLLPRVQFLSHFLAARRYRISLQWPATGLPLKSIMI